MKINKEKIFFYQENGVVVLRNIVNKYWIEKLKIGINKKSKVLEIASNDGSFIKILKEKFKSFVVGVDPARNLSKTANSKKIFTINKYFNFELSHSIKKNLINSTLFLQEMLLLISNLKIDIIPLPIILRLKLQYTQIY